MSDGAGSRVAQVRRTFETPEWYLAGTAFNIRIRQEAVNTLVAGRHLNHILDIGCGNGTISIPLLRPDNRLTLVDVSSAMIANARRNVPAGLAGNVELFTNDLMVAPLTSQTYDLIICVGVLAHVESPLATLARIASLLKPGGRLILEFTDAFHPIGLLNVLYHKVRATFRPSGYSLNLLSRRDVFGMLESVNLKLISTYRYGMWLPLVHKLLSQDTLYKTVRAVYGTPQNGRLAFLGNAYICLVEGNN